MLADGPFFGVSSIFGQLPSKNLKKHGLGASADLLFEPGGRMSCLLKNKNKEQF